MVGDLQIFYGELNIINKILNCVELKHLTTHKVKKLSKDFTISGE